MHMNISNHIKLTSSPADVKSLAPSPILIFGTLTSDLTNLKTLFFFVAKFVLFLLVSLFICVYVFCLSTDRLLTWTCWHNPWCPRETAGWRGCRRTFPWGAAAGNVGKEALPGGVILHHLSRESSLHGRSCEDDWKSYVVLIINDFYLLRRLRI